jgi:hypothetical protein
MGEVANGKRSHEIGTSLRLVAGLSPAAVFLPITNLLHFLVKGDESEVGKSRKKGEHTLQIENTATSDEPSAT